MDLETLRTALEASPENIPLLLLVAKLEEDQFALAEARNLLDRVLALDPGNREAALGIARLLDFSGETSEAMVRLEALCSHEPGFAAAWMLRAKIALDDGDAADARAFHDKAVALDPSLSDDGLFAEILRAGGTKRAMVTSNGDIRAEADDDYPFDGLDAVAARVWESISR